MRSTCQRNWAPRRRFAVEALENRINPVTFTVTNTLNTGAGSLRNAVASANLFTSADTIIFDPAVFNTFKVITLTTGEISISGATTITGPGANLLSISGNASSRAFNTTAALDTEPISFSGLTIGSCLTTGDGGAVLIGDEAITFTGCNLSDNISTSDGGALSASGAATITLTECNLINNQAQVNAGAIYLAADAASLTLERCTLSANIAVTGSGGAVRIASKLTGTMTVRNSTLSGNSAPSGGAVALAPNKGTLAIRNSTLTLNDADTGTGGAIARTSGGMVITIESSIVSGNTNAGAPDISSIGTVNVNFSAIGSNTGFTLTGGNNLAFGVALKLGTLANNGGPTNTHLPALDSPVVDAGANLTGLTTDQRGTGYLRARGLGPDIGASEAPTNLVVSIDSDSGLGSLRQTIADANVAVGTDTVVFAPSYFNVSRTITLTTGQISISDPITIDGPGANLLTISGNDASRVFDISKPSHIDELTITHGFSTEGGAIRVNKAHTTFDRCILSANIGQFGGAIRVIDCTLTLLQTEMYDNTATTRGGAIDCVGTGIGASASVTIESSTLTNNKANSGGAIRTFNSVLVARNTLLAGNSATTGSGGGIYFDPGTNAFTPTQLRLTQCTFSGNSASNNGGAVMTVDGVPIEGFFIGCTVTGNSAAVIGGALRLEGDQDSITFFSSVISGNANATSPDIASILVLKINNCAIGSAQGFALHPSSSDNLAFGLDLKLGPLADNGGPTKSHMPAADSPLIDKGGTLSETFDQRGAGYPRTLGQASDIGAVEFLDVLVRNTNDNGAGSLRKVIAETNIVVGAQTIMFDPAVFNSAQTITLTSGQIVIADETTIQGVGAALTTISGNLASRIFMIIASPQVTVALNDLTLTQGREKAVGGSAIYVVGQNLALTRVRITNNFVYAVNKYDGGAIHFENAGELTITDSVLNDNRNDPTSVTQSCGGAINIKGGSNSKVTIVRSTISGNSAGLSGGGIFSYQNPDLTIIDSTISGNRANLNAQTSGSGGGGIFQIYGSPATITNSTISSNSAAYGGGFYLGSTGVVTLRNSTVAFNAATFGSDGVHLGGTSSAIYPVNSIIEYKQGPGGLIRVFNGIGVDIGGNPMLGPLADNGGPTRTHALTFGSSALNTGTNPLLLANDQRGPGFFRIFGPNADIGAYESHAPLTPPTVTAVSINDGSAQRSRVTSLTVQFSQQVLLPTNPADAFQLRRQIDTASVFMSANVNGSSVTLAFTGGPVDYQSLADGRYTLTILASKIANLDGNGDGTPGDDYLLIGTPANGLFRIFGDSDGDGTVAANDFIQFRLALGGNNPIFDFDNDGAVAASDFIQFRLRFGGSI